MTDLVEAGAAALGKVSLPLIVVDVEGGEGQAVVAVQRVARIPVEEILMVQPKPIRLVT